MEGRQRITRSKSRATTPIQTTGHRPELVIPSISGQREQTSAESNSKARNQDSPKVHGLLTNFDVTPLATVLKLFRTFRKASIPSPLGSKASEWTSDTNTVNRAQDLYQGVLQQKPTLLEEVRTQPGLYGSEPSKGLLCWWEYLKTTSNDPLEADSDEESVEESSEGRRDLNYAWVDETMDLNINGLKGKNQAYTAGKVLSLCRLRCTSKVDGVQTGEFKYFIANFDQASLSINGVPIRLGTIAGPLPEFAVIDIDQSLLFWWGTKAALEFMPGQQSTSVGEKRPFSHDDLENLGGDLAPVKRSKINTKQSRSVPPTLGGHTSPANGNAGVIPGPEGQAVGLTTGSSSWLVEYGKRFEICTQSLSQTTDTLSTSESAHQLDQYSNLGIDDAVLAIAALRFGLGNNDLEHCFGNSDLYAHTRRERQRDMACGGTSNSFIVPLFFDTSSSKLPGENLRYAKSPPKKTFSQFQSNDKVSVESRPPTNGDLRHCMLAFARCTDDRKTVSIDFHDSKPGMIKKKVARQIARNLVRNSGWLGDNWPKFKAERWLLPPPQVGDTSGVHTILNAWSVMINLQVNEEQGAPLDSRFYAEALKVINLGLDGKLDSLTIRAFLQSYRYASPEDVTVATKEDFEAGDTSNGLIKRRTVLMNREILDGAINRMRAPDSPDYPEKVPAGKEKREDFPSVDDWSAPDSSDYPEKVPAGKEKREDFPSVDDWSAPDSSDYPEKVPAGKEKRDFPSVDVWRARLDEGLLRHARQIHQNQQSIKIPIKSTEAMLDDDTFMPIASVWEGLRKAGLEFAFGTVVTFRGNRTKETRISDTTAVLGPAPLIVPLIFGDEIHPKGRPASLGHHLLAVVSQPNNDDKAVEVLILDSAPGAVPSRMVEEAVAGLIRYTGWLGIDLKGRPLPVRHSISYEVLPTPHQEGKDSCGFYLILNAWAFMLGIDIHPGHQRRIQTSVEDFHRQGLKLINMALAGYMDSKAIEAFLMVHGYAAELQSHERSTPEIKTARLDTKRFENIIDRLRKRAKAELVDRTISSPTEDSPLAGATRPGATRPGATRPGATRPGATRPEATPPGEYLTGLSEDSQAEDSQAEDFQAEDSQPQDPQPQDPQPQDPQPQDPQPQDPQPQDPPPQDYKGLEMLLFNAGTVMMMEARGLNITESEAREALHACRGDIESAYPYVARARARARARSTD